MESIVYNLSNRSEYISSGNSNLILVYSNKVTDDPEEQSIEHFRFLEKFIFCYIYVTYNAQCICYVYDTFLTLIIIIIIICLS